VGEEQEMQRLSTSGAVMPREVSRLLREERGQGTTEYAILVGVLVVIAILAIIAFRGKVQELWTAIVNGMNAL
jgi:Flp pilus assembly pilin Flp